MLQLSGSFVRRPVMSLRTGGPIGTTLAAIINPNNLKIEGFYCEVRFEKQTAVLLTQDIRDTLPQGFVVDDHEALTEPGELVRLKDIIELNFELEGKNVVTSDKKKVGKVVDFAAESTTFYIQKLYVGQSMFKNLSTTQLSIDRNQIVEITNRKIVIHELLKPSKAPVTAPATS